MSDKLFNNIGRKIKALAKFLFFFGFIGMLLAGFIMLANNRGSSFAFLTSIMFMLLIIWISAYILYAFGELVEKICNIDANIKALSNNCKIIAKTTIDDRSYEKNNSIRFAERRKKEIENQEE